MNLYAALEYTVAVYVKFFKEITNRKERKYNFN